MKRLHYISALLCAAALTTISCSNEEFMENEIPAGDFTLIATTGADTRTSVNTNYQVNWTKQDAFYAFGGDTGTDKVYKATAEFTLTSGDGTTEGKFQGQLTGEKADLEYAVYPLSAYTSSTMTVTFPTVYTYPNSNAPMFGTLNAEKTKVEFKQLLSGMMRIKLNGLKETVSGSLKLEAAGIEGSAVLTITEGVASLGALTNGGTNAVTLNFTNLEGDVVLDIPVPAGTYTDGIKATLQIGTAEAQVFNTTTSFVMKAGTLKEMPAISNIEIDGSTGEITFSKVVENVADANKALTEGETNLTINEVKANETITVPAATAGSEEQPVVINVNKVAENATFNIEGETGAGTAVKSVVINVPENSTGTLNVTNIDHVEISGDWTKVTASTGQNTLVVKAGAKVAELIVEKGNIEIENNAVVSKLTLNADVAINKALIVPSEEKMEVALNNHTLTLNGSRNVVHGELTLTGTDKANSKVTDNSNGIALPTNNAKFTMNNVTYTASKEAENVGILIDKYVSGAQIAISNSDMINKYFCINTNASLPVGSNCTINLTNSIFTAVETALMVNIPATITATGCTFTGGWQGTFLRGGTTTFDNCNINLNVDNSYGASNVKAGATAWKDGNQAPSAALTAGNRSKGAYDYKTSITLKNNCTFSCKVDGSDSQDYPSIYLDAENKETQGVTLTTDSGSKTNYSGAGKGLDNRNPEKVSVNEAQ